VVLVREQRLRYLLLTVLSQAGYMLLGDATPTEARHVLGQRTAPGLILFDGAEASEERLREQIQQLEASLASAARCRVLVFSLAHPQPRLQQLPGGDALLARPFDLTHLLAQVAALLHAR
jgi:DNA-binding response OmpR family regulator